MRTAQELRQKIVEKACDDEAFGAGGIGHRSGSMRFGGVCAGNVLDIGTQPRVTMSARAPERQSARAPERTAMVRRRAADAHSSPSPPSPSEPGLPRRAGFVRRAAAALALLAGALFAGLTPGAAEAQTTPTLTWAGGFTEHIRNDGSVTGSITLTVTNGVFVGFICDSDGDGTDDSTTGGDTECLIDGTGPAGLTEVYTRTSDTVITVTLTGRATSHESSDSVGTSFSMQVFNVVEGHPGSDTYNYNIDFFDAADAPRNAPTVDAGPDQTVDTGAAVTLSGSATDPDTSIGDTLSYSWVKTSGPAVTLTGANTATPSFTAPGRNGILVFTLSVSDSNGQTVTDTVTVTVVSNTPVVTVTASKTSIEEGAAVTFIFTASPAPEAEEGIQVLFDITGWTAADLQERARLPTEVNFDQGESSATLVLQTLPGSVGATAATLTLALDDEAEADRDGYITGDPVSAAVSVTRSTAPVVTISAAPATITEGGTVTLTFTVDQAPTAALAVNYSVTNGTDFGLSAFRTVQTATIPAGRTRGTAVVETAPDTHATRADRLLTFALANSVSPAGADYRRGTPNSDRVTVQQDTMAPTLSSETVGGTALVLSYSEALDTDSTPAAGAFAVTVDGSTREVSGVSVAGRAVTLTLASAVTAGQVVTVAYTAPASNPIQDAAGNDAATFAARTASVGPTVKSVKALPPASDDTFRLGETITVQVIYNSRLTVTGAPRLALTVGTATRQATFSRVGNDIAQNGIVEFTYTVQLGDHDSDGIGVAGPIELNGGTMRGRLGSDGNPQDLTGAADLSLGAEAVTALAGAKVDARTDVTSIQITSEQPSGGTYGVGDMISVGVILNGAVWVSGGTPRLALEVGTATRTATFSGRSGVSGNTVFTFGYTVQAGDSDTDGIAIPAGAIDLNGAKLRDAAPGFDDVGNPVAGNPLTLTLAYAGLQAQSGHKVDGGPALAVPLAPDLSGVTVSVSGQTLVFNWVSQAADASRAAVTGYRVEWSADGNAPWTGITPNLPAPANPGTTQVVFTEQNVPAGTTRHYRVFALSASGDSPASATVSGTAAAAEGGMEPPPPMGDLGVPLAPTGLLAEADGETEITLRWTAPASDPARAAVTGYEAQWKSGSESYDPTRQAAVAETSHTISNLTAATAYTVQVRATSDAGAGAWSDEASAVTDVVSVGSQVDIPGADGVTVPVTTDNQVTIGTVHLEDGRTELTFTAAGSPLDGVTLTLPAGTAESVSATRLDPLPDGAAEPPPGADAPENLLNAAVELRVPRGARVCLPAGAGAGAPRIYRFDGSAWERATIMNQRVEGGRACGTVTQTSPFAVFYERSAAASQTAWIARFGRTVADQVIEAVDARSRAPRMAGTELTLGGQPVALDGAAEAGKDAEAAAAERKLAAWLHRAEDPDERNHRELQGQGMTQRDFLLGSSFSLAAGDERSGYYALWGRGAVSSFDGRDGTLTVDGEVASAFLGADWSRDRTTLGLILGHSVGDGGYASEAGSGTVSSTLTGLYPWMRHALSDRVSVWVVAGYGEGTLTLTPANDDGVSQAALRTDLSLAMGAVGLRGVLVEAPETGGVELAVKTDAMGVRTRSATFTGAGGNLAGTTAEVTRLRLRLEGSYAFHFEGGALLTPSLEVGVRLDGGDAETGAGLEVGGGFSWSDPARGLSVDLRGRGLLTHEDGGFRERGLSGSLVWDPAPDSDRGPSLTLSQTLGVSASDGGVDRLFREGAPAELAASGDGLDARSIQASFGYGFGVFGDRVTMTPEFDLGLSDTGRDYRLGWRLSRGSRAGETGPLELLLETTRREFANDNGAGTEPEHTVGFKIEASF